MRQGNAIRVALKNDMKTGKTGLALDGATSHIGSMAQVPTTPNQAQAPAPKPAAKKIGPVAFFKEVRAEIRKVSWASRNETLISTVFVFIMVVVAAVFFFAVDAILRAGVGAILNIGGGQ
jgi:preprotein translocase subunit SecE